MALGYSNYWDWKEDIQNCYETMNEDYLDEVVWQVSRHQVMNEYGIGEDDFEDDPYYDDQVQEFASCIIGLWRIAKDSDLYSLLEEWYQYKIGDRELMYEGIRDLYDDGQYIYFVTGTGYAIWSVDLLGGRILQRTPEQESEAHNLEREFDSFVLERM